MTYFNILNKDSRVQCTLKDNEYLYSIKEDGKTFNIGQTSNPPLKITKRMDIGKAIFKRITDNLSPKELQNTDIDKEFQIILDKLESDVQNQMEEVHKQKVSEEKQREEIYEEYYSKFEDAIEKHGFSPLEYIIRVFEGLGVNAELELTKSFCGYLQTFLGLKGTNVIGVGSQSSGKTHCVENPLLCIPDERVHRGTFTKASFFREYGGMDLTGHIFVLGDLGGVHDDDNTIESRDVLKQLSTDGFISKSYVDEDGDAVENTVEGYPSLAYTTVSEEMINDQEKSRSIILTPPDVNQRKLMIYDSFIESPGVNFELKSEINKDVLKIKGFVWHLSTEIDNVEMFNPFMFCVQKYLTNMDDFNRKIKEYNMLLKTICILNNSFHLTHNLYEDLNADPDEETDSIKLYIPSKQDVIDALTLFEGSTGLLPSEVALVKGLLKKYNEYPFQDFPEDESVLPDDASFEEIIQYNALNGINAQVTEETDDAGKSYLVDYNVGLMDENGESCFCFFALEDIKRVGGSQRWYKEVRDDLSNKLYKLYSYGLLVKIGKNEKGHNVYGLGKDVVGKIGSVEPAFAKKDVDLAKEVFHQLYPSLSNEFDDFVSQQMKLRTKKTTLEIKDNHLYELIWNTIDVEDER